MHRLPRAVFRPPCSHATAPLTRPLPRTVSRTGPSLPTIYLAKRNREPAENARIPGAADQTVQMDATYSQQDGWIRVVALFTNLAGG